MTACIRCAADWFWTHGGGPSSPFWMKMVAGVVLFALFFAAFMIYPRPMEKGNKGKNPLGAPGLLKRKPSDVQINAAALPALPADWDTETAAQLATHGWMVEHLPFQPDTTVVVPGGTLTTHQTKNDHAVPIVTAAVKSWGFPQVGPSRVGFTVNFARSVEVAPGVYKTVYTLHNTFWWSFWWSSPLGAITYNVDAHHVSSTLYPGATAGGGYPSTYPFDYDFSCGLARQCHHTTARLSHWSPVTSWIQFSTGFRSVR